jgi:predicted transcriptional regulator
MSKKLTIEFRDPALYRDLEEIARLVKEPPEELLQRAFREWVELREDLEDAQVARERIEEYERTGNYVSHEEVGQALTKRRRSA